MPVNPINWLTGEAISAKKLNTDLYNYLPGNAYSPNGILFHTQKPILAEYISYVTSTSLTQTITTGGFFQKMQGPYTTGPTNIAPINYWDSAAYYGPGTDQPWAQAQWTMKGLTPGADGFADNSAAAMEGGGYFWLGGHTVVSTFSGVYGTGISFAGGSSASPLCTAQLAVTNYFSTSFALDILHGDYSAQGNPQTYSIGSYAAGAAASSVAFRQASGTPSDDWSGECMRQHAWWAAILDPAHGDLAGRTGTGITVPGGPTPPSAFTSSSAITSAALNANVVNTLNFLNMPPLLRRANISAQAFSTNPTHVLLTTGTAQNPNVDTYSGYNNGTDTYTVPVSGVYLVHGAVAYQASSASSYNAQAGINVNGTTYWGPAYQTFSNASNGNGVIATVTRLMDLHANDTVQLMTYNNGTAMSGWAAGPTAPQRLCLQWMGALGVPSTLWTNPDPSFRWQAGTPGAQLPALFNTHLVNDLGFLVNRPYLLTRQGTAQTGLANNTSTVVTADTVGGQVHGSNGDNYSGWTSGAANKYTCQRTGWYLVVGEYCIAHSATAPVKITAQVTQNSGDQANAQYWGQSIPSTSGGPNPGATYVGVHFLRAASASNTADTIQPSVQVQPASGTSNTAVAPNGPASGNQASNFGLIWLGQ